MRLFVAVWPPGDVVERLLRIERPERPGVRWTTPDQWHVTLQFLGEAGRDAVERALEGVRAGPATAVAGPAFGRLGPSVLCLPVAGLDELAAEVRELTAGCRPAAGAGGPAGPARPFRGHVTLARNRRGVDFGPAGGATVAAVWRVRDFTLVASRLHSEGARYEVLARYPLRPDG